MYVCIYRYMCICTYISIGVYSQQVRSVLTRYTEHSSGTLSTRRALQRHVLRRSHLQPAGVEVRKRLLPLTRYTEYSSGTLSTHRVL